MAWSIFTDGGGKGAALTWAQTLLTKIGAPVNADTTQVVYDWEVSEGGGGKYNPLNQGPVPGHTELASTGSQYGGGAADYTSWDAGLTGAADYLNMSNYVQIKQALIAGDAAAARSAIVASPWASSHYGNGASFSTEPPPGQGTSLPGVTDASFTSGVAGALSTFNPFSWLADTLTGGNFRDLSERAALIILGGIVVTIGLIQFTKTGQKIANAGQSEITSQTGGIGSIGKKGGSGGKATA